MRTGVCGFCANNATAMPPPTRLSTPSPANPKMKVRREVSLLSWRRGKAGLYPAAVGLLAQAGEEDNGGLLSVLGIKTAGAAFTGASVADTAPTSLDSRMK